MQVLYVLVPLSVMLVAIGVVFFVWAAKTGQFDDLEGPAHRILFDEDEDRIPEEARIKGSETADDTTGDDAGTDEAPEAGRDKTG